MKIYEYKPFASPRRVRVFLAEKGIAGIPFEQVDVPGGEHRGEVYLRKNPYGAVPTLELDDGTCISESVAICRYFEERQPEPRLMGKTPEDKAEIEMWQRRVENSLFAAVNAYFHHATPGLVGLEPCQNREWGLRNRDHAIAAMRKLDVRLADRGFIANGAFSIADITALAAVDFGAFVDIAIPEDCIHLKRWYGAVSSRPSAAA